MRRRAIPSMPRIPANIRAQTPGSGIATTLKEPVTPTLAAGEMGSTLNANLKLWTGVPVTNTPPKPVSNDTT